MRPQHGDGRTARKGGLAGEAFVEDAAEGVLVGTAVDRLALDMLGGHVVDRADELARGGQPGDGARLLGEAEVGQVDVILLGEQDVGRLDVAVDEPAAMSHVEGTCHLRQDRERQARLEGSVALEPLAQVGPVHVAHRDVENAVGLARVEDRDHVRVVELCDDLRFTQEALAEALVLGQLGGQQLQRRLSMQPLVLGQIHDAHTALADDRLDPVASEHGPDQGIRPQRHEVSLRAGPGEGKTSPDVDAGPYSCGAGASSGAGSARRERTLPRTMPVAMAAPPAHCNGPISSERSRSAKTAPRNGCRFA